MQVPFFLDGLPAALARSRHLAMHVACRREQGIPRIHILSATINRKAHKKASRCHTITAKATHRLETLPLQRSPLIQHDEPPPSSATKASSKVECYETMMPKDTDELVCEDEIAPVPRLAIDPVIESQEMHFQGNIIVLSNGYCFSACAALLSNLQNHDLATIIGESPGSYIGRQFGYPVQVQLPNTGLMLSLPAMEIILHEDVGLTKYLEPDQKVTREKMDVITDSDVILKRALELIRQRE